MHENSKSAKYGVVGSIYLDHQKTVEECGYETGSCDSGAGVENFNDNIEMGNREFFENLREEWK